jgi:hypothetical protein
MRHVSVPSPFHLRSVKMVCVHTVRRVQSPSRTARDRRLRKTVHIIGIEQLQTGPDPFRHVKHSRSATGTERNRDVTETFLSI